MLNKPRLASLSMNEAHFPFAFLPSVEAQAAGGSKAGHELNISDTITAGKPGLGLQLADAMYLGGMFAGKRSAIGPSPNRLLLISLCAVRDL